MYVVSEADSSLMKLSHHSLEDFFSEKLHVLLLLRFRVWRHLFANENHCNALMYSFLNQSMHLQRSFVKSTKHPISLESGMGVCSAFGE